MKESVLLLNRGVSESVRYIGIDIGGTKCAVTAGDENCAVLEKVKFPTRTDLGKEQAINLGVDYDRCIRKLLLGVALCIAVATAMVGPVSFLGLIIANLARQLLCTYRHSQLIAGTICFGMVVLIGGQLIVEQVFSYGIPVSVFITSGGGCYFLYLLLTNRKV